MRLRADCGALWIGGTHELRGAQTVARSALRIALRLTGFDVRHALVTGAAGVVTRDENGQPLSVMGFTVRGGRVVEIDVLMDHDRLGRLDMTVLDRAIAE